MPRVVDPKPSPKVEKIVLCRDGCGATIAYVPNDVKSYSGSDYSGGPDGHEWIVCPNCRKRIIIRTW
jgi:hypothetical protein